MLIHRLGAYCWFLATPLFAVANIVTGLAWRQPRYSWMDHNISDLGNVTCGLWDTTRPRDVCSPWHDVMNSAIIATGILLGLGVLLTWRALGSGAATKTAQLLTLAGAIGYVIAGAYPADVNENLHFLGALLIFFVANAGMLVASLARRSPLLAPMRVTSLLLGLMSFAGTVLFLAQVDVGFGVGGLERVAVFPLLIWTVAVGVRLVGTGFRR